MPALDIVPPEEQTAAEESPALRKFREAMGASRFSRLMATYILTDELDAAPAEGHDELIRQYAKAAGTSPEVMRVDLRWARAIPENLLRGTFAAENIPDLEWSERITLEHLRTIVRATRPDGSSLNEWDMVARLLSAYHADETGAEFKDHLRKDGLIRAREPKRYGADQAARDEEAILKAREAIAYVVECLRGERGPVVQQAAQRSWARRTKALEGTEAPATLNALLGAAAEAMTAQGKDIPLKVSGDHLQPRMGMSWLLRKAAQRYDQLYPGAEFTLAAAEKPKETPIGTKGG